ncbi:sarcosine oxidase subunit gamma [Pararhodobacter oceanensis]|uniref:Sarcosine oxidase subunit gamma n=1 Tax=Pararhodobacter oceanensis TaxID=2172121 RepID=A0A2T8HXQ9_9RHOB|nr:sarcosine oxidase subunit gamma [Pararhodobacter oceanensis]PVH30208.1 sarcosine oxidase subunit gamma [Pararhodobacter oceanensis]
MHDLTPITALGGTAPRIDSFDGLEIRECPDWALASVAARLGRGEALVAAAQAGFGLDLPQVGKSAASGALTAFWTGPEQWFIEAPFASHEDLAAQLVSALGQTASVTEQSDGWVRFDLEGSGCHRVLERLCNADVERMAGGDVTRTRLEHLGCFLICRASGAHFSVLGPRSAAGSLHHALVTMAVSAL